MLEMDFIESSIGNIPKILDSNIPTKITQKTSLKAIDFFCGGGGMTCGMKQANINVVAGIDIDEKCRKTYEFNNQPACFIQADISTMPLEILETQHNVKRNDDEMIFIGCSPCQYWSIINTDRKKSAVSKDLLKEFQRFVEYYLPGYVVIENVPGILNKINSPLDAFISFLEANNYRIDKGIIKTYEYGIPQTRKRFLLIASRLSSVKLPPKETKNTPTVKNFIGDYSKFPVIEQGHKDLTEKNHTVAGLQPINLRRLKYASRKEWEQQEDLQINAYKKMQEKGYKEYFKGVYERMEWNKPAPTITTKFFSISNGKFAHPEQDRAISLREGATLQTFPDTYVFKTQTISDTARLIGNAVPPELAKRIGDAILVTHKKLSNHGKL
jgi:DNA (cytosine-5)-methyltransferase 1